LIQVGNPLPFLLDYQPYAQYGVYERLSEFERDTVAYLKTLNQMSISDLLDVEGDSKALEAYLSK
jgi:hypothetical protein